MASTSNVPAKTPEPPYYAVIFTAVRTSDSQAYVDTASRMLELAARQPGYFGVELASRKVELTSKDGGGSARTESILVSYWRDEASISAWKKQTEHVVAQNKGRREWYEQYSIRVCKVERAYTGGFGSL